MKTKDRAQYATQDFQVHVNVSESFLSFLLIHLRPCRKVKQQSASPWSMTVGLHLKKTQQSINWQSTVSLQALLICWHPNRRVYTHNMSRTRMTICWSMVILGRICGIKYFLRVWIGLSPHITWRRIPFEICGINWFPSQLSVWNCFLVHFKFRWRTCIYSDHFRSFYIFAVQKQKERVRAAKRLKRKENCQRIWEIMMAIMIQARWMTDRDQRGGPMI